MCVGFVQSIALPQIVQAISSGITQPFSITTDNPEQIQNGTIISFKEGQYQVSPEAYDKNLFGVVVLNPALQITYEDIEATSSNVFPVQTTGLVQVLVSSTNGSIQKGDRITSSDVPGIGMKAEQSGFSLGIAEADFIGLSENSEIGTIPVTLQVQFAFAEDTPESSKIAARLRDLVNLSSLSVLENPITALQYVTAALVVLASIVFSFFTFTRVASTAVVSLGRNPLAKQSILMGLIVNGGLALAVLATGVGVAYFMVTFR